MSKPRLTALRIPAAAQALSAASGEEITDAAIREDIAAGAPVNEDGTLNLLTYAAWLIRKLHGHA